MKSYLIFLNTLDAAYRAADPAAALRRWFLQLPDTLDDEARAHYRLFLQALLEARYEMRDEGPGREAPVPLGLHLDRGEDCLASAPVDATGMILASENLIPGDYRLATASGWVLWESALTEVELLWSDAYPDAALPVAASTDGETASQPSLEHVLLDGELTVRVFPGPEFGYLEVSRHVS